MAESKLSQGITKWNWKIHVYLGLYMLLFLWLFGVSGIIMNHPGPHQPHRVKTEHKVRVPETTDPQLRAEDIQKQLGIVGEPIMNRMQPNADTYTFRAHRPGQIWNISVNLKTGVTSVGHVQADTSSLLESLHVFSGVRPVWGEPAPQRDWLVTRVWSFTIDAVAIGLMLQALSSFYMWFKLRDKWVTGLLALIFGIVSCLFFLRGLAWLA